MEVMNRKNYLRNLRRPFLFLLYFLCFVKTLILRSFQLKQKYYTNCGYKHVKTTHVLKKTLINDLTFRLPQHTSSGVTVRYNTIRFIAKEKDCNLIKTIGHFGVLLYLCFKTSLSAKPFI